MKKIALVIAATEDHLIGLDGKIPWHITKDLQRFKHVTMGGVVIMGNNTWKSLNCKPLPGRINIVITHEDNLLPIPEVPQTDVAYRFMFNSDTPTPEALLNLPQFNDYKLFIIGGASLYSKFFKYCNEIHYTHIHDILGTEIDPEHKGVYYELPEIHEDEWTQAIVSDYTDHSYELFIKAKTPDTLEEAWNRFYDILISNKDNYDERFVKAVKTTYMKGALDALQIYSLMIMDGKCDCPSTITEKLVGPITVTLGVDKFIGLLTKLIMEPTAENENE